MNESQFDEQMTRLTKEFGKYSSTKLKIFWDHYKGMPNYLFTEVVTELLGSYARAPLKPQFDKQIAESKSRAAYRHAEPEEEAKNILPPPEKKFTPDEAWIDKMGQELALKDPNYNHEKTKAIMMGVVKSMKIRQARERALKSRGSI